MIYTNTCYFGINLFFTGALNIVLILPVYVDFTICTKYTKKVRCDWKYPEEER
jgi:hypothetical protein